VRKIVPAYVLDSFALFAYFQAEAGGPAVRGLFESAIDERAALHVSLINVGEIYYIVRRAKGDKRAEEMLKDLRQLPIILDLVSEARILAAARIKSQYALSYADAFAVALAHELRAQVVTGDPEFKNVDSIVNIMWLVK
jgi:predicted nucleic acid-binding protein